MGSFIPSDEKINKVIKKETPILNFAGIARDDNSGATIKKADMRQKISNRFGKN
jgi:hypothetical protein